MGNRERKEAAAQDLLGFEPSEPVEAELGNGTPGRRVDGLIENVGKPPQKFVMRPFWTVDGHVLLGPETEDPQIISSVYMIRVDVCDPDGIDMVYLGSYQLEAQFGGRIDQKMSSGKGEKRTMPRPSVPGIVRSASRAVAPDYRDTEGCARPEKGELHTASRVIRSRNSFKGVDSKTSFPHRMGRGAWTEGFRSKVPDVPKFASTPGEHRGAMTYHLIADNSALQEASRKLRAQSRIALDCEAAGFHRYTDKLCLVQLSTEDETFLFDPFSADPSEVLRPLLEDPEVQVVMHGADFDIRLLHRDLNIRLRGLFDTQTAATLLGAKAIGLASLLEEHLDVKLSKKHQRADWAQRPLPDDLLDYASNDTRYLFSLGDILARGLRDAGREGWAWEEFRSLEEIRWVEDQADPVTRFKGARHLTPRQVTALRTTLSWRDRIAQARDRAPFRVVGDSVLVAIVMERPTSVGEMAALKGMSPRLAQTHGPDLLAELDLVEGLPEAELRPYPRGYRNGPGRLLPEEEALADKVRALRSAKAQELGLEKGVLLSNAQIAEIIRSAPQSVEALKTLPGVRDWQVELLGPEIIQTLKKNGT